MQEYLDLGHAQQVSLKKSQATAGIYYMPVHAVFKDSSTTTKVRAVFDASAKTTSQKSLNDLLAVGPTLHPTLDKILMKFRTYAVAISGDISKMYREVLLHPEQGLFQNLAPGGGAKVQYQNLRGGIYNYTHLYIPH